MRLKSCKKNIPICKLIGLRIGMETGAGFVDFAILGDVVVVAGGLRGGTPPCLKVGAALYAERTDGGGEDGDNLCI